jgi:hypothetical protein
VHTRISDERAREIARLTGLEVDTVHQICQTIYIDAESEQAWLNEGPIEEIAYCISQFADNDRADAEVAQYPANPGLWDFRCCVLGTPWQAALMAWSSGKSFEQFAQEYAEHYPFGVAPPDLVEYMVEQMTMAAALPNPLHVDSPLSPHELGHDEASSPFVPYQVYEPDWLN